MMLCDKYKKLLQKCIAPCRLTIDEGAAAVAAARFKNPDESPRIRTKIWAEYD
jgi:hypothetical protein